MKQKNITDTFNKVIQKRGNKLFKEFQQSVKDIKSKKKITEKIKQIALEKKLDEKLLEKFFKQRIFLSLSEKINIEELTGLTLEKIKEANIAGMIFIQADLKKVLQKSLYLASRFGFKKSVSEKGIRTANEGDSVQFLFVAELF